jgi:hypothetical protein
VTRYATLLARPGAAALVAAGVPARLPIATYGIGLLALGRAEFGSFGPAGAVVATYVVAAVAASVLLGRPVQRPWFPRLLVAAAALDALALVALVAAARAGAGPVPVAGIAAALGLALPPAGVLVRARWADLVPAAELDAALFLESALDEAMFVVGPLLVTTLGSLVGPGPALLAAGAATTAGLLGLAGTGWQSPGPVGHATGSRTSLPRLPGLCAGFLALGTGFAAIQVGVLAGVPDAPSTAGLVLTWFSVVSLVAGLVAGRLGVAAPLRSGLAVLGTALLLPPLAGPTSSATLALLLVPAAVAASPSVALGYGQAARLAAPDDRARVFAWCGAALGGGLALGSAAGGVVADVAGPSAPFLAGAVVALLGALVAPGAVAARDCSRDLGVAAAGARGRDQRPAGGDAPRHGLPVRTGPAPGGRGRAGKDPTGP